MSTSVEIKLASEDDLEELLPLMRGYCDFYKVAPSDQALIALSRALLADPQHEGVQLIARADTGQAVGFATVYWTWHTLNPGRLAVMNDLFVSKQARGTGVADALILACADEARRHGALSLDWQTAKDNARAQKVYERVGAERSEWLDYSLALGQLPS
ncbi:MAG: GNAT family N-acetyltransferase [Solirubrobacterales bacterium]|nr:GNAT family N-acetyltransferase [Solirubrobacterales bacterium]